jgi:hypothetical protein
MARRSVVTFETKDGGHSFLSPNKSTSPMNDFVVGENFIVRDFDNTIAGVYPTIEKAIDNCPARMGRIERILIAEIKNLGR